MNFEEHLMEGILDGIKYKQSSASKGVIMSSHDVDAIMKHGTPRLKITALRSKFANDHHIFRGLNDKDEMVRGIANTISRIKINQHIR